MAPCSTSLICTVDPIGTFLITSNENCIATVSPPSKRIGNGDSVRLMSSIYISVLLGVQLIMSGTLQFIKGHVKTRKKSSKYILQDDKKCQRFETKNAD